MKKLLILISLFLTTAVHAEQYVITDYVATPVSTAAYTQIIASTQYGVSEVQVFDSSGQTIILALGGSGSEVPTVIIPPGGMEHLKVNIPKGSRVSYKAVSNSSSTSATAGQNIIKLVKQI